MRARFLAVVALFLAFGVAIASARPTTPPIGKAGGVSLGAVAAFGDARWAAIGSGISGSGANTQCAIWTGASSVTGDSGCTFNTATDDLTIVGAFASGSLSTGAVTTTGNTLLGDGAADTHQITGLVGIGGVPVSGQSLALYGETDVHSGNSIKLRRASDDAVGATISVNVSQQLSLASTQVNIGSSGLTQVTDNQVSGPSLVLTTGTGNPLTLRNGADNAAGTSVVLISPTIAATTTDLIHMRAATSGTTYQFSVTSGGTTTITGSFLSANGSQSAPAFAASADSNSGWYFDGTSGRIDFASDTIDTFRIDAGGIKWNGGSNAATPSLALITDTNTGFYGAAADDLAVSTGGTLRWDWTTTQAISAVNVVPSADVAKDLGTSSLHWNNIFVGGGSLYSPGGASVGVTADDFFVSISDASGDHYWGSQQSNTGSATNLRLPGARHTTAVHGTCANSSDSGYVEYIDDTNDGIAADECTCIADSAGVYSWVSILNHDIATGAPVACAL